MATQSKVYTVTLNPAIDYIMQTERLTFGETNRSKGEVLQFGGKGINVSTVLSHLGVPTIALGFIAGFTGAALQTAVAQSGVTTEFIQLSEGQTRINVKLRGEGETEINAGGPQIPAEAVATLLERLERLVAGDTLVLAGSVPPSLPTDIYATMLSHLAGRGIRFVVDATGEALRSTLPYHPFVIKPNRRELEELVGRTLPDREALVAAARELQQQGAERVLVSLGGEGALLLDAAGEVHTCAAHRGEVIGTVGAGDSMLAGFLAMAERGEAVALRFANAAGAATAFGEGLATREAIADLFGCF